MRERRGGGRGEERRHRISLRQGALQQDISILVTGGQRHPSEEVMYRNPSEGEDAAVRSQKDARVQSDVWEDCSPSSGSPHGHSARLSC